MQHKDLILDKPERANREETSLSSELLDERGLSKLKWRCRRGLLENDLFIERFFKRHESSLSVTQAQALSALMDLSDNDLLDLHLSRKTLAQVSPELDQVDVREVLEMLKSKNTV